MPRPLARTLLLLATLLVAAASARAQPADGPKVVWNYPRADATLDREAVPVIAVLSDESGVKSVEITVNGTPLALPTKPSPDTPPASFHVNARATLAMGRNTVALKVTSGAGKTTTVTRTVTRVPPPPPPVATAPGGTAKPPAPAVKGIARYAVVIGVGAYDRPGMPPARFAQADAQAMYDFLTTTGGYPKENVQLVSSASETKPTLTGIRRALGVWLHGKAGKDDSVLVYFAGQGAPEMDAAGREKDGLSKYLVTQDTDPESLFSTALAMTELERVFARLRSERVVFLVDTDFTGQPDARSFVRQRTRAAGMSPEFLERLGGAKGRVLIMASGTNEAAREPAELQHGLFTHYVLQGLGGAADRNGDGFVTVSELYSFVQGKVVEHARRLGVRQSPVLSGAVTDLPLTEIRKR